MKLLGDRQSWGVPSSMCGMHPRNVLSSCKAAPGGSEALGTCEATAGCCQQVQGAPAMVAVQEALAIICWREPETDRAFGEDFSILELPMGRFAGRGEHPGEVTRC